MPMHRPRYRAEPPAETPNPAPTAASQIPFMIGMDPDEHRRICDDYKSEIAKRDARIAALEAQLKEKTTLEFVSNVERDSRGITRVITKVKPQQV